MKKVVKAIVHRIIEGKHGPFVVVHCDHVDGSVTFSLSDDVWLEKVIPELGAVVRLFDLRQKRAGWRATTARFWAPEDEVEEQLEKQRLIEEIIQYCKHFNSQEINSRILTWLTDDLNFDDLFARIKDLLEASQISEVRHNSSLDWGTIFYQKINNENQALKLYRWQNELRLPAEDFLKKGVTLKSSELIKKSLTKIKWSEFDFEIFLHDLSRLEKEDLLNDLVIELETLAEENVIDVFTASQYKQMNQQFFPQESVANIFLEIDNSYLLPRLKALELMAELNLVIEYPKLRLEKIAAHLGFFSVRPKAGNNEELALTQNLKKRFSELYRRLNPPQVSEEGLDLVQVGDKRIAYLNKELVGDISEAYNIQVKDDAILYEKHFLMPDIFGDKRKISVFLWVYGDKVPREIYTREAYTEEGYLDVSAKFESNYVVVQSNINGLNYQEKRFTLESDTGKSEIK